jgi:hypothetical protein
MRHASAAVLLPDSAAFFKRSLLEALNAISEPEKNAESISINSMIM